MKRISIALLLVAAAMVLVFSCGTNSTAESQAGKQPANSAARAGSVAEDSDATATAPEVVAYYFHTTYRCAACKKIEAYTRESIEAGFADELANGTLEFHSVNIQEPENKHFVKDYQLYTKSVVICDMEDGHQVEWKNLAKVWQLTINKNEFTNYVQNEINVYLKES